MFDLKWSTKKIRSLFRLKDKNPHPAFKIYEGSCSCSANYIGKTKRNIETQQNERDNPNKDLEPAKRRRDVPDHKFDRKILLLSPNNTELGKILESSIITLRRPQPKRTTQF